MPAFADIAKNFTPSLLGSLAGAATGAGAGYLTSSQEDGETPEDFQKRRMQNATTYGLAGGAVGMAAPVVGKAIGDATAGPGPVGSALRFLAERASGAVAGAGIGGVSGGVGSRILNKLDDPLQAALDAKNKLIANAKANLDQVKQTFHPSTPTYMNAEDAYLKHMNELPELDKLVRNEQHRNFISRVLSRGEQGRIVELGGEKALAGVHGARMGAGVGALLPMIPQVYDHTIAPLADAISGNQ